MILTEQKSALMFKATLSISLLRAQGSKTIEFLVRRGRFAFRILILLLICQLEMIITKGITIQNPYNLTNKAFNHLIFQSLKFL